MSKLLRLPLGFTLDVLPPGCSIKAVVDADGKYVSFLGIKPQAGEGELISRPSQHPMNQPVALKWEDLWSAAPVE